MPRRIPYSVGLGPGVRGVAPREFADKVAQVLADPRGWRKYGYEFYEVPGPQPGALCFRLETAARAAALCSAAGFSCWRPRPNDIVINLGNWMGGSKSRLPLDRYRNYVICHETGHSLGLGHQACPAAECARRGLAACPASVMQQMTRGAGHVAPCIESDWPLDPAWLVDDPARSPGPRVAQAAPRPRRLWLALALVVVLVVCAVALAARRGRGGRREPPPRAAP